MELSSPPHPLMHFGMTGWFKIRGLETFYYKSSSKSPSSAEEWPPKYSRFHLSTSSTPPVEAAFIDSRRFARIRLIDCSAAQIRSLSPLCENGPDPVQDKELVTEKWLAALLGKKHVPIKALLLDQANISGIGNWVGDEILYHAKIHPEQYSNTLTAGQISQLHKSIHHVCGLAVELLADSEKFPEEWLFKHRWGKGKKDAPKTLPNGKRITFVTVGGRTSAVIASVQKKTGPVAGDIEDGQEEDDGKDGDEVQVDDREGGKGEKKGSKAGAKKRKDAKDVEEKYGKEEVNGEVEQQQQQQEEEEEEEEKKKPTSKRRKTPKETKDESPAEQVNGNAATAKRATGTQETSRPAKKVKAESAGMEQKGRRRSARVSEQGS